MNRDAWGEDMEVLSSLADALEDAEGIDVPWHCECSRRLQRHISGLIIEADGMLSKHLDPCHGRDDLTVRRRNGRWYARCIYCEHIEEADTLRGLLSAWESWREGA